MATIKIVLRTSKINKEGEVPLCIRITKNRQTKFVFLDYRIKPDQWDAKEKRVKKSNPNYVFLNNYLAQRMADAQSTSIQIETEDKHVASRAIKASIKGLAPLEFFEYANKYARNFETSGKIGTHRRAKAVIQKLLTYVDDRKLYFDQINVTFLKNYESYLIGKLKNRTNTVHANFRMIRTIFNNAISEDLIPVDINPFPKFKLKLEKTQRDYLTDEELNQVEQLQLNVDSAIFHHRNIYVFAAYAGGMRISDILTLRWKNFDGEKINIKIHKTKTPLSIKLPAKALEILSLYKKEQCTGNDFVFPLINISADEKDPAIIHNAISSATAYTNKDLKKITELASIEKHLSFHTSRHSFAVRALQKGMRIEYVSKLMGHADIKETQIYAKVVSSELDKAMDVFN